MNTFDAYPTLIQMPSHICYNGRFVVITPFGYSSRKVIADNQMESFIHILIKPTESVSNMTSWSSVILLRHIHRHDWLHKSDMCYIKPRKMKIISSDYPAGLTKKIIACLNKTHIDWVWFLLLVYHCKNDWCYNISSSIEILSVLRVQI